MSKYLIASINAQSLMDIQSIHILGGNSVPAEELMDGNQKANSLAAALLMIGVPHIS